MLKYISYYSSKLHITLCCMEEADRLVLQMNRKQICCCSTMLHVPIQKTAKALTRNPLPISAKWQ